MGPDPNASPAAASRAARWGDLRKRALSAALLAPTALLCIWLGAGLWTALMAVAAVGLGMEWASLSRHAPLAVPGVLVPAAIVVGGAAAVLDHELVGLALLLAGAVAVWRVTGLRSLAAGVIYVGVPMVAIVWLRGSGPVGRSNVLFLVLVVWAADIGAYAVGRLLGGPKLAPSISPGKTWSGAVGGLAIAMLVGEAAAQAIAPAPIGQAALVAGMLGVVSVAGDLLESAIKRRFGVKDSGRLIPGHGGLLDRLDGLLAAAPAAAALSFILGRGSEMWR
jgi:phosphatidate cytidylyltransferase